jgi:hypothetical protein
MRALALGACSRAFRPLIDVQERSMQKPPEAFLPAHLDCFVHGFLRQYGPPWWGKIFPSWH